MNTAHRSTGMIFDIKRGAMKDGPGVRTTVFLKGCPLRCPWCHNPEGQNGRREFIYRAKRCDGCKRCVRQCPGLTNPEDIRRSEPESERCSNCLQCTDNCPTGALSVVGRTVSAEEILEIVLRDKEFYGNDGGVTFSGGEPLSQPEFLKEALALCRRNGINTCIETSGYCHGNELKEIQGSTDLFMFDIKLMDAGESREIIGVDNKIILENLVSLLAAKTVILRMPMVAGITDTEKNITLLTEFLKKLNDGKPQKMELLPFHNYGESKYGQIGKKIQGNYQASQVTRMKEVKTMIEDCGIEAEIKRL